MLYEIHSGSPSAGKCEIRAYDESCELMAVYDGFYDLRRGTWVLYPKRRYALSASVPMKKITLSEREVRLRPPRMETAAESAVKSPAEGKPVSKGKAWWTLPDPDGQLKLM